VQVGPHRQVLPAEGRLRAPARPTGSAHARAHALGRARDASRQISGVSSLALLLSAECGLSFGERFLLLSFFLGCWSPRYVILCYLFVSILVIHLLNI